MTQEQINTLKEFAKFLDNEKNSVTPDMWQEKIIWQRTDSFQEYLQWYLYKQPTPTNNHE